MNKKYFTILISFIGIFLFSFLVNAQGLINNTETKMGTMVIDTTNKAGIVNNNVSIGVVIALVIKAFLSILALLFLILIILGGYYWMTAGGDETKMTKAKDFIKKAIIGLIIIISTYAITSFTFRALDETVSGPTTTP